MSRKNACTQMALVVLSPRFCTLQNNSNAQLKHISQEHPLCVSTMFKECLCPPWDAFGIFYTVFGVHQVHAALFSDYFLETLWWCPEDIPSMVACSGIKLHKEHLWEVLWMWPVAHSGFLSGGRVGEGWHFSSYEICQHVLWTFSVAVLLDVTATRFGYPGNLILLLWGAHRR